MKITNHVPAESESRPCVDCGSRIYAHERCDECACFFCYRQHAPESFYCDDYIAGFAGSGMERR